MTICYFGIYNPNHTRNRLNIKGLRLNGVEVLECNIREQGWQKYWQLIRLHWPIRNKYQVMIVGFPGHTIMPLAWILAKLHGKKIIFDAFISLYDSLVFDEKKYQPRSLPALKYWLVDWLACQLAGLVVLEVYEYAKYFIETFGINPKKFRRVLVSCDNEIMYPRENPRKDGKFTVHFHGTYIPAQGIDYIIGAARLLKDKRAGAFKIMEAMAMKKSLITADTPAVREFLVDGENSLLCRIADSQDLSEKIMLLKDNPDLQAQIAQNGYDLFQNTMTPEVIGEQLFQIAKSL